MESKHLPIGSIVMLKNDIVLYMIVGYLNKKDGEIKDYISISFPYGFVSTLAINCFNNEDIERLVFQGYKDDKHKIFNEKIINLKEGLK